MIFNTYGDRSLPSLILIHGMANTAQLCYGRILPYLDEYHVILCELDGHSDKETGLFISIEDCCEKIEKYAAQNLEGKVYGISGEISDFGGEVTFWHGSNEPYPGKTVKLLKRFLPRMQVEVFEEMGHGQFLNEHPEEYAYKMKKYLDFR